MSGVVDRHVIAREGNVLRVDFERDPDPPAPKFPGACGLRPVEAPAYDSLLPASCGEKVARSAG